jgi:hypothetical protein
MTSVATIDVQAVLLPPLMRAAVLFLPCGGGPVPVVSLR